MAFGFDDALTYGGVGLKGLSALKSLVSGSPAAIGSSLINLAPTGMSLAGSAMGGSASGGLSALASGVAPGLASGLSLFAAPAAVAAIIASRALTEQLTAQARQGKSQMEEYSQAMRALPGRVQARAQGAGVLGGLADLKSPDELQRAYQTAQAGIQGDLERMPLWKSLTMAVEGPDRAAKAQYGDKAGHANANYAGLRDTALGNQAADNYAATMLLRDKTGQDPTFAVKGAGGGGWATDDYGNYTGQWQDERGGLSDNGAQMDRPWTYDRDFLENAVVSLGSQLGIDKAVLEDKAKSIQAGDVAGWDSGNSYGGLLDYLSGLDPNAANSDAMRRYRDLSTGLAGL